MTTKFTASDVQKVIAVMLLYGVMWGAGLLGILLCSARHEKNRRDRVAGKGGLEVKKRRASLTQSGDDIRQYLTAYGECLLVLYFSFLPSLLLLVVEVLPSVFRPKAGLIRFWEEVSKSHRYLLLFTASGEDGDKKRMLTGLHLLTVQSMLMFILAVFYDLQYPQDDGACQTYVTQESCLKPTSALDASNHLCRWVSDSSLDSPFCESRPVTMTVKVLLCSLLAFLTYLVDSDYRYHFHLCVHVHCSHQLARRFLI
jgi:hypothetical protein